MSRTYTRNDKFYHALSEFMYKYNNYLITLDDYHKMEDWTIKNKTTSHNSNLHVYLLIIPTKFVSYTIDVPHKINGVIHEPGPVYKHNKYIFETIEQQFGFHFNAHHRTNSINHRISEAYVVMTEIKEKNDEVICKLHVKYHNHYPLPFPVSEEMMSSKEQNQILKQNIRDYQEEVQELERINDELYVKYIRQQQKKTILMDRLDNNNSRTQHKIRELYKMVGSLSNCPVCWEPIDADKLVVPGCSHFICETCDKKCSQCPLCREHKNPLCST